MADLDTLERALRNADAAGDTDAARTFAQEINKMRAASPAPPQASMLDKVAGSAIGRTAIGLASPLLGAAQAGAHIGDAINTATGTEPVVSQWIDSKLKDLDASKKRGMASYGHDPESMDWWGLAGALLPGAAITKGVASALPSAAGAVTKGMAAGAATAGTQPLHDGQDEFFAEKAKQTGIGALFGGATAAIGKGLEKFIGRNQLNPTQAATLEEGKAAGYVTPPSSVNPSGLNNTLESIAGKAAVGQEAAAKNQKITNIMTAKALGLPTDQPVTPSALKSVRDAAGQVYEEVEQLSPTAKAALRELKDARHKTSLHFDHYFKSKDPAALEKAEYHKGLTELFEQELEGEAGKAGRAKLVKELADARMKIAKTYDVERALGEADSNVSAPILGRAFDKKGGKAVTGELATIGKMAEAFPAVMREGAKIPTAGVSGTDAAASAILGTLGYGAGGPPGMAAAALPLLRPIARHAVLSPFYQKHLAGGIPERYLPLVEAMMEQAGGAAGTATGRSY